jgi:hypothetical protein
MRDDFDDQPDAMTGQSPVPPDADAADVSPATPTTDDTRQNDAFDIISDEDDATDQWRQWVCTELIKGGNFDDLTAHLVAAGWESSAAADLVEECRKATRFERGVRTREDVASSNYENYRKSMRVGFWIIGFPLFFTIRLFHALKNIQRVKPPAMPPPSSPRDPRDAEN